MVHGAARQWASNPQHPGIGLVWQQHKRRSKGCWKPQKGQIGSRISRPAAAVRKAAAPAVFGAHKDTTLSPQRPGCGAGNLLLCTACFLLPGACRRSPLPAATEHALRRRTTFVGMIVLLLGSGGREHALAHAIASSSDCEKLFTAPGNPGTAACGRNVALDPLDFEALMDFCEEEGVDLVVVGPEAPLVAGIVDAFGERPTAPAVVGPGKDAAQLEGSKAFAKAFMARHGIPTAGYKAFTAAEREEGLAHLAAAPTPIVLKADGLAAGKGVLILEDRAEAQAEFAAMLDGKFGDAGHQVVVEQFLDGVEMSVFAVSDGETYALLPSSKDYKRIGEGDTGLNTGGMGAISPVPYADTDLMARIRERIVAPTVRGLAKDGLDYRGFIYFGLMIVDGEPLVIEYNCRMGDPETQAVLPLLDQELLPVLEALPDGRLDDLVEPGGDLAVRPGAAATIVLASGGYPEAYSKDKAIEGPADPASPASPADAALIYHAGTRLDGEGILRTNGGRVMACTGRGPNLAAALDQANAAADTLCFEKLYRRSDIGSGF